MADRPPLARTRSVKADTVAVLIAALRAAKARQVLDLGCGEGLMTAELAAAGFAVTGVDPSEAALQVAQARLPEGRFLCAEAEALPPGLPLFDAAIFVNALHHVAPEAMERALTSALAALHPGAPLIVVEPLAAGSFFRAMRPIEDETAARLSARAAVEWLVASGGAVLRDLSRWDRESRFSGLEGFAAALLRAGPGRAGALQSQAAALARAWRANIRLSGGEAVLVQPLICWTLAAPGPGE